MDIDFFFPETVSIEHASGNVSSGIRAQIERSDQIILCGNSVIVSVDDVVVHPLDNGAVHHFSVQDVSYHRAVATIPPTTKLKVRRHGSKDSASTIGQHVYNVSGNNARINVHSADHSTNIVSPSPDPIFNDLRTALEALPCDHPQKDELLALAGKLSNTPPQTATFTVRFQQFMALAADCMTVITPFVPALVTMLGHQ